MFGPNKFKFGLFGMNCSGGTSLTAAPERWNPTWSNVLTAAKMADEAGIDFLLPVARWFGYGGDTDAEGTSFESLAWASALLAATKRICVFATVHVPFISPVFAAKQVVTADHVGGGRFGLNVVSGWYAEEFEMFGLPLLAHDERYTYTEEWVTIAKRLWSEEEPFDFKGKYFDLKGVLGKPRPFGNGRPLLMSAGSSGAGRAFAARHADCLFMIVIQSETLAEEVRNIRAAAGRPVGVYSSGHIVCRRTQKEAEEYYHDLVYKNGDWAAVEKTLSIRVNQQSIPAEKLAQMKERLISGLGTLRILGSPDTVANTIKQLSDAGLDGSAFGLINYIDDLPLIRDEVLPRLERLGVRAAAPELERA
jgi:FMNH2-dependent dimethyl sulfone monooxygenase